jgi:hypothetical protein
MILLLLLQATEVFVIHFNFSMVVVCYSFILAYLLKIIRIVLCSSHVASVHCYNETFFGVNLTQQVICVYPVRQVILNIRDRVMVFMLVILIYLFQEESVCCGFINCFTP